MHTSYRDKHTSIYTHTEYQRPQKISPWIKHPSSAHVNTQRLSFSHTHTHTSSELHQFKLTDSHIKNICINAYSHTNTVILCTENAFSIAHAIPHALQNEKIVTLYKRWRNGFVSIAVTFYPNTHICCDIFLLLLASLLSSLYQAKTIRHGERRTGACTAKLQLTKCKKRHDKHDFLHLKKK